MKHKKITYHIFLFLISSLFFSCKKNVIEIPAPTEQPETEPLDLQTDCSTALDNWNLTTVPRPDLPAQHDIFFLNKDIGFTVGSYGIINKTQDGGRTWNLIHHGNFDNYITRMNLQSIYFLDEYQGFITGQCQGCTDLHEESDLGAILFKNRRWWKYLEKTLF